MLRVIHARCCAITSLCAFFAGAWLQGSYHVAHPVIVAELHDNNLPLVANGVEGASLTARGSEQELVPGLQERDRQDKRDDETLMFLHIPKNAGTTIEELGLQFGLKWAGKSADLIQRGLRRYKNCIWYHVPPSFFPQRGNVSQFYYRGSSPWIMKGDQSKVLKRTADAGQRSATFCILRNPYDRVMSEFKYRLRLGGQRIADKFFPNQDVVANCTPEYMNAYLQQRFRTYHITRYLDDCHLIPQASWVFGNGRQWCTEILDYATLDRDFNNLMQ
eukprot:5399415-Amphidinium_carterae.1